MRAGHKNDTHTNQGNGNGKQEKSYLPLPTVRPFSLQLGRGKKNILALAKM